MPRPRSDDKPLALLNAGVEVIAHHGVGAPTALIAKKAGVAEASLFRYFPTKDALLNELYLFILSDRFQSLAQNNVVKASVKESMRASWNDYIDWGLHHPVASKAITQLALSNKLTRATRAKAAKLIPDFKRISEACTATVADTAQPVDFGEAMFMAMADATITFCLNAPADADGYRRAGFNAFWKGMTDG